MFGLNTEQAQEAGRIAKILGEEWAGLVTGQQGYMFKNGLVERVRWGEMVSVILRALIERAENEGESGGGCVTEPNYSRGNMATPD